jgi:hypothetical protein
MMELLTADGRGSEQATENFARHRCDQKAQQHSFSSAICVYLRSSAVKKQCLDRSSRLCGES